MPSAPRRLGKSSCGGMILLEAVFTNMEASSQGAYPGAMVFIEEG